MSIMSLDSNQEIPGASKKEINLPRNPIEYLKNEWWDMVERPDYKRIKQLKQDAMEVYEEMILQEREVGKTGAKIAEEYDMHLVTVYKKTRNAKRRRK